MHIKQTPEDFLVEEIPSREFNELSGELFVYRAIKRDMTTPEMIRQLSRLNGLQMRDIRYAGLKDRFATTMQYITSPKKLTRAPDEVILEDAGYLDEPLHLGELSANRFRITIRDIDEVRDVTIPNYYGDQRFSSDNVRIGKALLTGKYMEAAEYFARQYADARRRLDMDPGAPVDALAAVPQKILLIYVHSVQSWLYNEAVSQWIADEYDDPVEAEYRHGVLRFPRELEDREVPLVGAAQELGDWEKYYAPLLDEAGLSPQSFRLGALPHLTQEGGTRTLLADIREKHIDRKGNSAILTLTLGPGCYATVCIAGWFA